MTVRSALTDAIDDGIRPLGFRHRRSGWYRRSEDLYSVVNIQSSSWDRTCYLNLGFMPGRAVEGDWLPVSRCWLRFRADAIAALSVQELSLLDEDLSGATPESELRSVLASTTAGRVASLLAKVTDLSSLKAALESDLSKRVFIHREMRELLETVE